MNVIALDTRRRMLWGRAVQGTGLVLMVFLILLAACAEEGAYPEPPRRGDDLFVEASLIQKDIPVFFTYATDRGPASFFILRNDDGVFAFHDACETCYPQEKGYGFADGYLICKACNQQFSTRSVIQGVGGCYPIRINGRETEEGYLVPIAELEKQAART